MLTSELMREMWPHADAVTPGLTAGMAAAASGVFAIYGLSSRTMVAHAMAQFSHECGAGDEVVENLNYSAQGLMLTWPSRFGAARAADFAHDPRRIANEVYNGRMGNAAGSDDGWRFRGRGGSQVTGREGYGKLAHSVGLDLLSEPDLVLDPRHFLACAVADFVACGCLPFAAHDDVSGVTYHLNGGFIGLAARAAWLARWNAALPREASVGHGAVWVQQSLNRLGHEPPLIVDGTFGPVSVAAVMLFQGKSGLQVDGTVGPATVAAIERALGAL